jgi:phosphonate transport system permease protein
VKASLPLLPLLPALVLLPLLLVLPTQLHPGGLELIGRFLLAAVTPSRDPQLLASLLHGLAVTLGMALLGWLLSLLAGLCLGLMSSRTVWASVLGATWPALLSRRLLALPRAIHELLWGLLLLQLFGLQPVVAVLAIAIPYGALVARVMADLIDATPTDRLEALISAGAPAGPALITALGPTLLPGMLSYGGYRLECALRSATLLGVFGLGGLGTELRLTLQSLEFHELWSGLWLLLIVMLALENSLAALRRRWTMPLRFGLGRPQVVGWRGRELALALLVLIPLTFWAGWAMGVNPAGLLQPQPLPPWQAGSWQGVLSLPWPALVGGTVLLTALSALLAVGLPPLQLLLVAPWPLAGGLLRLGWALLRLWPPPLTVLLLLFVLQPGVLPAALALGLHNGGILGRLLREGLQDGEGRVAQALSSAGCGPRMALLYGDLPPLARPYLAYGAYRADVILRETVVVGLAGAAGLGSQLLESLSSFAWDQLAALILVYVLLTLIGEDLSDRLRRRWLGTAASA